MSDQAVSDIAILDEEQSEISQRVVWDRTAILWDRLFGTYCPDTVVERCGAGKGKALSIKEQLALAFYSNKKLKDL